MMQSAESTATPLNRRRLRRAGLATLLVFAVLVTLVAMPKGVSAQEFPTEITGRVVQGTPDSEVPAGLRVVLLVVDEARQEIISNESTIVGTNGRFSFSNLLSGPGLTYRVAVDDDSYTPSVDLTPGESSFDDVEVTIYDRTQSFEDIRVSTYSMLVPSIDRAEGLMGVLSVVSIINSGNHVWVPDIDDPGLTGLDLLRFNLPEGFSRLSVESNLPPGGNILEIGTGFALTNPVPPGEFDILMTYIAEYDGSTLDFPLRLPYGADLVRIMLPEGEGNISGLGLSSVEGAIIEDTAYSVVDGRDYPRDSQLDVQFTGLPTPSLLERTQEFFDGRGYIIVIAWIAGAAMLALLVYAFFFARQRTQIRETDAVEYPEYEGLERAEIVETIARLDEQHEAGEIEETDYSSRRAALTQAALRARTTEAQTT